MMGGGPPRNTRGDRVVARVPCNEHTGVLASPTYGQRARRPLPGSSSCHLRLVWQGAEEGRGRLPRVSEWTIKWAGVNRESDANCREFARMRPRRQLRGAESAQPIVAAS